MSAPESYVDWINHHLGFNPRSQAASNALADFVLDDLRQDCPPIRPALEKSVIASRQNAAVRTAVAERNVDLVLYEETERTPRVRVTIENKTIMAAHGKARKNRYGDIIAYCNHVHNNCRQCVAGAVLVINTSSSYVNPDGFAKGLKRPAFKMDRVVSDTVGLFERIPLRKLPDESNELPEGLTIVLIEYNGADSARLVNPPETPGDSADWRYENFLRRMCERYAERFT
jgi:hypothetical protein